MEDWSRYFRHRHSIKLTKNKMDSYVISPTSSLWKDFMLCRLDIILNSNQGLALLRQKQILRSNRNKHLQKQNNKYYFVQLPNAWLHFKINNFRAPTYIGEILDQPIFLKPRNKLDISYDNPYFYCIPSRNISDKFTIIRDLCRFILPGLISSTAFDEKLGFYQP